MKKCLSIFLLSFFAFTAVYAGVTRDEVTQDSVRWFEMDFNQKKLKGVSPDLEGVKLILGYRNHLNTGKQSAYLSLAIDSKEGTVSWGPKVTLLGSNGQTYTAEVVKEDKGFMQNMTDNTLYRLDILEINTPDDLVSFYRDNMINTDNNFIFTLEGYPQFKFAIYTKSFQTFFSTLANEKKLKVGPAFDLLKN